MFCKDNSYLKLIIKNLLLKNNCQIIKNLVNFLIKLIVLKKMLFIYYLFIFIYKNSLIAWYSIIIILEKEVVLTLKNYMQCY